LPRGTEENYEKPVPQDLNLDLPNIKLVLGPLNPHTYSIPWNYSERAEENHRGPQ
jgi:hypothetical protein